MTDFFRPKTVADCHKLIEDVLSTNRTQATEIRELKAEIVTLKLQSSKSAVQKEMALIKWKRMRNMHLGLKAVLASLSSTGDDFEEFEKQLEE